MPRPRKLVSEHVPSRLATELLPLIDDSKRFDRANYLVKTERDASLFLIDELLSERSEEDEDLGTRAEQAWWRVWQQIRGTVIDSQYVVPEAAGNLCEHLRIIETLELSFCVEHVLATPEGKQLLDQYDHEIHQHNRNEITYAA